LWCPCCGYRLRTKPRNLKYKAKLRARTKTVEPLEQAIVIQ
jgi:DNA-directed RNA polymerase subunit RPC12/RpoP